MSERATAKLRAPLSKQRCEEEEEEEIDNVRGRKRASEGGREGGSKFFFSRASAIRFFIFDAG